MCKPELKLHTIRCSECGNAVAFSWEPDVAITPPHILCDICAQSWLDVAQVLGITSQTKDSVIEAKWVNKVAKHWEWQTRQNIYNRYRNEKKALPNL